MSPNGTRLVVRLLAGFIVFVLLPAGVLMVAKRRHAHTAAYAVLISPPQKAVWLECRGDEMRLASSLSALKGARATKAVRASPRVTEFPWVDLPVQPIGPGGPRPTQVRFTLERDPGMFGIGVRETRVTGDFACRLTDARGAVWSYSAAEWAPPGNSPDDACVIHTPRFARVRLSLQPRAMGREVGIGLHLLSHDRRLSGIRRNGRDVEVHVRLLDRKGRVVAAETASLGAFEFT